MKQCLFFILCSLAFVNCSKHYNEDFAVGQDEQANKEIKNQQKLEQSFTQANKIINLKEKENIFSYIDRRGWKMKEQNGIYLQIVRKGEGCRVKDSSIVKIDYDCFLLNGRRYGTTKKQSIAFNVRGDTRIPFGLMSAMKNLQNHSQVRIIIPSNLAFTISDNGEKISQDNTLIYLVKILEIKDK
ncbi:MAG: FKBP-type peptidyl-prolyl cis-trans isomerase [Bacteroidales bacterium]